MLVLLTGLLVTADQITKWWAKDNFSGGGSLELGLGFAVTFVRNTGAAFGLLRDLNLQVAGLSLDGTLLLGLLSLVVAVSLGGYLWRRGAGLPPLPKFALVLVLAGALGNMIDRLLLGYVVDFIHFRSGSFDFPVFNMADSYVVVGGALLFLGGLLETSSDEQEPKSLSDPEFFQQVDRRDP